MLFIVTVKMPKNPVHDPKNKITGACPTYGQWCTDVTGEHHSLLIEARSADDVRAYLGRIQVHLTRIERAETPLDLTEVAV
jgi:hypothetical protein